MVFLKPHKGFVLNWDLQAQLTAPLLPQPQAGTGTSQLIFDLSNYSHQPGLYR